MALAPVILIIGGTDSSGGAGMARDIATAALLGVSAAPAVTSVTAQTHRKVLRVEPVSAPLIALQIRSAFEANTIGAVKIGMLGTVETVKTVSSSLEVLDQAPGNVPVIFDPVLAASSNDRLACGDMRTMMIEHLLPLSTLVTPNLAELAELTSCRMATDDAGAIEQGHILISLGARAVLVKGGHATGDTATDYLLADGREPVRFSRPRLRTTMRGTGCTLATAIAAGLALGLPLEETLTRAQRHVFNLLKSGTQP